jgi:hypothetical protein
MHFLSSILFSSAVNYTGSENGFDHIAQVLVDYPELATMSLTNPDIVKNFFIYNVWSFHTFEYIWFWMRMNVLRDD